MLDGSKTCKLSIYDLSLLPQCFKGLSMKETRIQRRDQNCIYQLILSLIFFQDLKVFVLIVFKLKMRNGKRFNNGDCQRLIHKSCHN